MSAQKATGRPRTRGRPPGPPVDPVRRREELLTAAESAMAEHGPQASLAQVAQTAGLTRSAVYAAFADRDELTAALAQRQAQRLLERIRQVIERVDDPREQTRQSIEVLVCWFDEHRPLSGLLDPRVSPGTGLDDGFGEILAAGFRSRGLTPSPARTWARALIGAVSAAMAWWARTEEISRDELVDHLTLLIWSGFAGDSPGPLAPDSGTSAE